MAMKVLFDLFPVILFFIAYRITGDIFIATPITMGASLLQIIFAWYQQGKVDTLLWISFILVILLGTATLVFRNQVFIYWKPTAIYWLLAAGLVLTKAIKKINLIQKMMGTQLNLPEAIWVRLNTIWALFFFLMGLLNLLVAFYCAESTWVNFKLFGTLGLTLLFIVIQSFVLSRYFADDTSKGK